jgi:hypothetical protein
MKYLLLIYCCLFVIGGFAQDSLKKIEPGQETSFDNNELLILAILGLLVLIGLRFWFKRTRKQQ